MYRVVYSMLQTRLSIMRHALCRLKLVQQWPLRRIFFYFLIFEFLFREILFLFFFHFLNRSNRRILQLNHLNLQTDFHPDSILPRHHPCQTDYPDYPDFQTDYPIQAQL